MHFITLSCENVLGFFFLGGGTFPITSLTCAQLHMNSLTQCLSGESGMAVLSIGLLLQGKHMGYFSPVFAGSTQGLLLGRAAASSLHLALSCCKSLQGAIFFFFI